MYTYVQQGTQIWSGQVRLPAQWANSGGQAQIKESTGQCQLLVLVTMFIVFKNIILVFLSPFLVFLNVFSMCFWVCFIVSKLFCECVSVLYYP